MEFNFKQLQKKYAKKSIEQEQEEANGQLIFKQELQLNPLVAEQCKKIERDFVTYHNNNRYFYLHEDKDEIDELVKLKNDEFHNIRKQYEVTLVKTASSKATETEPSSTKKKMTKIEKEARFRHYAYLFRKNVKIVVRRLKMKKITIKDIFDQELFSDAPYRFGKKIFEMVKEGEETKVWRCYIQNKFVVYSVDSTMKTPLIWACIRGFTPIAKMLIEMGALHNKKDYLGHSALFYALHYKNQECVKLLILHQAEILKQDIAESRSDKRMRDIIDLCLSIMGSLRRMPIEKRSQFFQTRLKHIL